MLTIFKCPECGKLAIFLAAVDGPVHCGDIEMKKLIAGATDGAKEKHVPVVAIDGNKVTVAVGSVEHPMTPEHLIDTIIVETNKGVHIKELTAEDKPYAEFTLADGETFVTAYENCNLHGLWKAGI